MKAKQFFQILLRLYPLAFRERFGLEMMQLFAQRLKEASQENRLMGFWWVTVWDVILSSLRVRLRGVNTGQGLRWSALAGVGATTVSALNLLHQLGMSRCYYGGCIQLFPQKAWELMGVLELIFSYWMLYGVYLCGSKDWFQKFGLAMLLVSFLGNLTMMLLSPLIPITIDATGGPPMMPQWVHLISGVMFLIVVVALMSLLVGQFQAGGLRSLMGWALVVLLVMGVISRGIIMKQNLVSNFSVSIGMEAINFLCAAFLAFGLWGLSRRQRYTNTGSSYTP